MDSVEAVDATDALICPLGTCQCPQTCQSIMLGLYHRPLCFSYYFQPRITCTEGCGVCFSLNNETLGRCAIGFPVCFYPPPTPCHAENQCCTWTGPQSTLYEEENDFEGRGRPLANCPFGPVTIIDAQQLGGRFWRAFVYPPSVGNADVFCEVGYFARCLVRKPLLTGLPSCKPNI